MEVPSSAENTKRRFYIKTFGCQMNVADTERMSALLAEEGMEPTPFPEKADVILINGCTVREKAVHKAVSFLGGLQTFKRKEDGGPGPVIAIGGCVGQLEQAKLFRKKPYLDFVFGTDTIDQLPSLIQKVDSGERHFVAADFDPHMSYSTDTKVFGHKAQAFVNIMKGCDKFCTYCIVPFTRGREKSRTIDEVVADVGRLVAGGVREVTLLGQNVNSFGKGNANLGGREPRELHNIIGKVGPRDGEENFPQLLRALDSDPRCAGLKRIRFTSSHPLDFSDELLDCYLPADRGGVSRLAAQLHLPVQSGSNRLLQKMGRHHQIEHYVSQMERLRAMNPDVALTTDIIVGFPTETEEDFQASIELLDRLQYDSIFAFAYSPRPGTRAAKLPDDVPSEVKNDRLNRILQHQLRISNARYAAQMGRVLELLVEGPAKNQLMVEGTLAAGEKVWMGRAPCNRPVHFVSSSPRNLTGRFVEVKIVHATPVALYGELIEDPSAAEIGGKDYTPAFAQTEVAP
jgi:tRNA-2-methylthio-N6-dimethylallyladenosine synthase